MKRLTRVISILGAVAMSASVLAGCGKTSSEPAAQTGSAETAEVTEVSEAVEEADSEAYDLSNVKLMSDGVLSDGCEVGYPPFEDFAEDGTTPIGFDVDIFIKGLST